MSRCGAATAGKPLLFDGCVYLSVIVREDDNDEVGRPLVFLDTFAASSLQLLK